MIVITSSSAIGNVSYWPFYLPDLKSAAREVVFQLALYILGHENPPWDTCPLHSTGNIHRVAPQIVQKTLVSDYTCKYRSDM
jgi:hypothetical protein